MRKFIFVFILLMMGFQYAQAQKITETYYFDENNPYASAPLDGLTMVIPESEVVLFPIMFVMVHTGSQTVNVSDSLIFRYAVNGNIIAVPLAFASAIEPGDTLLFPLDLPIRTSELIGGANYSNYFCVDIPVVYYNGVATPTQEGYYCSVFHATGNVDNTELTNLNAISMYPNPVSDRLTIDNLTEATDISVYSITGQLVKTISSATGSTAIDVDNLSNGFYIVKMQSGKNIR
ncbi:MAG: T9SS type A sorting domain-containing protein, partial [Bacteroidales bacterium]|nr:T9SS type A sorting domain-containing protein [Bacteroidales bacterium]